MDQNQKVMLNRCFHYYFTFSYRQAQKQHVEYKRPNENDFINACGKIFYSLRELVRLEDEWNHLVKLNVHHLEKSAWIKKKIMPVRLVTQRLIFKYVPHNPYEKYVLDNGHVIVNPKFNERKEELNSILKKGIITYLQKEAKQMA